MKPVYLPDSRPRLLSFYLAEEEWLAMRRPVEDFFFVWSVGPSVIVGRNQLMEKEVDMRYCRDNGIKVYRRKSGGGAVYADEGNLMLSLVSRDHGSVERTFGQFTAMVAESLRALGLDASDNSRNDILISGRKVSGNSYSRLPGGRCIVHGTMLHSCDAPTMARALTPSATKLSSHGVESVRSRITTVSEHLPSLTAEALKEHLLSTIPDESPETLTQADVAEIERMAEWYHRPEWLTDRNPPASLKTSWHIDGVGELGLHIDIAGGKVRDIGLSGDFMDPICLAEAEEMLRQRLRGVSHNRDALLRAIAGTDIETTLPGLGPERLVELLTDIGD